LEPESSNVARSFHSLSGTTTFTLPDFVDLIHSYEWTNLYDWPCEVHIDYSGRLAMAGSSVGGAYFTGRWELSGGGANGIASKIVQNVAPDYDSWAASDGLLVPAGQTVTVTLTIGHTASAPPHALYENAVLRVVAMPR
jgi:hypothetical protein